MLLKDWLRYRGVKLKPFCDRHGFTFNTLKRALGNERRISAETGLRIEEATKGEVSAQEAVFPERYPEYEFPTIERGEPRDPYFARS